MRRLSKALIEQEQKDVYKRQMYARGRVKRPNASDLSGQLPKIASDTIPPDFYTVTYNVNSQSLTSVEFFFPYAFPLYGTQRLNFSSVISFRDYESGNINNPVAPLPEDVYKRQWVHCINLKDIAVDLSLEYLAPQEGQNLEWQRKGTNLRLPQWGKPYMAPP